MKPLLKFFLIAWAIIFVVTFFTADDISLPIRFLCSAALACFATFLFRLNGNTKRGGTSQDVASDSSHKNRKYTIRKPLDPHILYRIENRKVYEEFNVAPIFEIKGDKVYPVNSSRFMYRIEKAKIYEGMNKSPFLEIRGSKIYPLLVSKPVYEIKEEK